MKPKGNVRAGPEIGISDGLALSYAVALAMGLFARIWLPLYALVIGPLVLQFASFAMEPNKKKE